MSRLLSVTPPDTAVHGAARTDDGGLVRHDALLDALADAVLVVDSGQRIRYANAAAQELFSAGRSSLNSAPLADFIPADSPITAIITQAARSGGQVAGHDLSLDTPRTGPHDLSVAVTPLNAGPSSGEVLVVQLRESGLGRELDRHTLRRGASRSVAGFYELLAHEVRNPLAGMRGAAQLLAQRLDGGVMQGNEVDLAHLIRDEVDRVTALVDRMAAFTDDTIAERQPVNVHEVLDHVLRLVAVTAAPGVRLETHYDPSLPLVHGRRDQLVQAVLNLVKNALEALPASGGRVRLSTAFRTGVRMVRPDGGSDTLPICIAVEDDGPGVPADLQSHLFEPFVSARAGGSGLGLALVAKVVDDHGGQVRFTSRPRHTVFEMFLPATPSAASRHGAIQ
ncbi:MAG: ATP-binding protein [Alphaproteobacteria bacterium]